MGFRGTSHKSQGNDWVGLRVHADTRLIGRRLGGFRGTITQIIQKEAGRQIQVHNAMGRMEIGEGNGYKPCTILVREWGTDLGEGKTLCVCVCVCVHACVCECAREFVCMCKCTCEWGC